MSTKEQYWKYSLIAIIIGLGIILFRQIAPFMGGLLGALTIYILVRKQMMYLSDKRKMKRSIAATLITAEAILCFLVPLGLVVWLAVVNLQNINLDPQAIIAPFEEAANIIKAKTGYYILGKDTVAYVISILPRIGQAIMGGISSFAVNIFVLVFVLYFMLIGGKKMEQYVNDLLPFNDDNTQNVIHEINMIVRSNAIGIPLLAVIQGGVAMIGYWIFGAPNINKCLLPDWSPSTPIAVWAFDIVGALDVLYAAVVPLVDKSTSNKCINVYDNVTVWNTTR
jgi:predicted PurR-regulated permease PerM